MTATLTRAAFTVGAKDFASAVSWAAKRVPSRPTAPTLGGILLAVADGTLTVSGFDCDASASAHLPVDDASDGRVLVSGRLLAALLGTFPDKLLQAITTDKALTLTSGRATVTLPLMPVEDYPQLPVLPPEAGTVDGAELVRAVRQVGSSCDLTGDKNVAEFMGINLIFLPDTIGIEATNRHRAAYDDIAWTATGPGGGGMVALAPGALLFEAMSDLVGPDERVTIGISDGLLSLATPKRSVVLRLLAEEFPAHFRRLMPPVSQLPARVDVTELKRAVDRIRLLGDTAPLVSLTFDGDGLTVSGTGPDASASEPVVCAYTGEARLTTYVSARYLLGALAAVGDTLVDLSTTGPRKPLVVTPASGGEFRQLVVPVAVR